MCECKCPCGCEKKPVPHIHAELIKAWADGAKIQIRDYIGKWIDWPHVDSPAWSSNCEYRIKPEVKPDSVFYTRLTNRSGKFVVDSGKLIKDNVKITFDGETGKLKSVELI